MSTAPPRPALIPGTDELEPPPPMTEEEFLALPEDGIDRELIFGTVREFGMTIRNRFHGRIEAEAVYRLRLWLETQPEPRGVIVSGEIGFRLHGPDISRVGADVAYVSAELEARTGPKENIYDGPPVLAVEILSGSEHLRDLDDKIRAYLDAGAIVWVFDPRWKVVYLHRPGRPLETVNVTHELVGDPELPGFRVPVALFFPG